MDLAEHLNNALKFETVFVIPVFGRQIPVTETVVVSWAVMAVLIIVSLLLTRNLKKVPPGAQAVLEMMIEFLEKFSREHFGPRGREYGYYIGTVFLFLLLANILPVLSPISVFGYNPPFTIKPPARDINLTAALAITSILIVLVSGLRVRGLKGWFTHLTYPVPLMIPFNLMEYIIRPTSLCLRLFGNILGAFIIMRLIEAVVPVGVPVILSLYFDFLDGLIQALVFSFLTSLFIAEAIEV
jgi:F-type H+-transporting ATPase subunit a